MADVDNKQAYFEVELKTSGPAVESFKIGSGAASVSVDVVTLNISTLATDVQMMKIWGDVDPDNNADIQQAEENSAWINFAATQQIKFSTGDGSKTIYCKLRDDVLNEGAMATATVTLNTNLPLVSVTSGPTPNKISKVATKNESTFTFQGSVPFVEYKVGVVFAASATENGITIIGTANGSENMSGTGEYTAEEVISCKITGQDLEAASPGDGKKVIKVFIKTAEGVWSV